MVFSPITWFLWRLGTWVFGLVDVLRFYWRADKQAKGDYWKWCFGGLSIAIVLALLSFACVKLRFSSAAFLPVASLVRWTMIEEPGDWLLNFCGLLVQLSVMAAEYFLVASVIHLYSLYEARYETSEAMTCRHWSPPRLLLATVLLVVLGSSWCLTANICDENGSKPLATLDEVCSDMCRKQDLDLFLPTAENFDATCNAVASWKMFHFLLMAPLGLTKKWYLVLFLTLLSWLRASQLHRKLGSCPCETATRASYTELALGVTQEDGGRLMRPQVDGLRPEGPYDVQFGGHNFLVWLCGKSSRNDHEAFRKELGFTMISTTLQASLDFAAGLSLLADGLPVHGTLILLSLLAPCLDDPFRSSFRCELLSCYDAGMPTPELWRNQWAGSFFAGVTVMAVSMVTCCQIGATSACTSHNLAVSLVVHLLFGMPGAWQCSRLLGDPLLDQEDFYDIQQVLKETSAQWRRSLVVGFSCAFLCFGEPLAILPLPWQVVASFSWVVVILCEVNCVLTDVKLVCFPWLASRRSLQLGACLGLGALAPENPGAAQRAEVAALLLLTVLLLLSSRLWMFLLGSLLNWKPWRWEAEWFDPMAPELWRLGFCALCVAGLRRCGDEAELGWKEPEVKANDQAELGEVEVDVTEDVDLQSKVLEVLPSRCKVKCLEVQVIDEDGIHYTRGRIEQPAGWITLRWEVVLGRAQFILVFREWNTVIKELRAKKMSAQTFYL